MAGLLISWVAGHFLIATTMLAVGLFAVMSWDSTFPNRRDVLVLSPLPIRARTLLSAKVAAVATALGITVLSLNVFTGIIAPVASASAIGVVPLARSFAAYWIATFAAGAFIFCGVLTVQGLAQLLPRQQFLRVSSFLQMAFFVLLLTVYFLQPPFSDAADLLRNQRDALLDSVLLVSSGCSSSWPDPHCPALACWHGRALIGLAIVVSGAAASYLVCYWRTLRRIAEQPDILPTRGGLRWLPRFGNSFQTAVAQFSIRTLLRSRQHRVILSFYLGIALGLAILLSSGTALQHLSLENGAWYRVNMRLAKASDIILCFAVLGIRVVFSMPLEIRANWIFRVTSHHRRRRVCGGQPAVALRADLASSLDRCRRSVFLALAPGNRRRTPGAPGRARNLHRRTWPLWLPQDSVHLLVFARQVAFQYGDRLPLAIPDDRDLVGGAGNACALRARALCRRARGADGCGSHSPLANHGSGEIRRSGSAF